ELRGLFLAGGAAHPGRGMPVVLMSGWIAADTLDRDGEVPKAVREPASEVVSVPEAVPAPVIAPALPRAVADVPLPRRSAWRVKWFTRYFRRGMGESFHAVRVAEAGMPPQLDGRPPVLALHHP